MTRPSWEEYAIDLAHAALWRSEDQHHRVGCALLRPDMSLLGVGYNGAPPGMTIDWSNRDARREYVIHAESNALRYARPDEVAIMASTMMPCLTCVKLAASYRIPLIVYEEDLDPDVYPVPFIREMARSCGIEMRKWRR